MAENFNLDLPIKLIIIGPTYYVLCIIFYSCLQSLICIPATVLQQLMYSKYNVHALYSSSASAINPDAEAIQADGILYSHIKDTPCTNHGI